MESFSHSMDGLFDANEAQEQPISTQEMRKEADKWSLQSDTRLLSTLKSIEDALQSKTEKMEKDVNRLIYDSKMKGIQVNNLINEFQMLENCQFIENRVYDEEIDDSVTSRVQMSDEIPSSDGSELDIRTNIKECLATGFKFLESVYPDVNKLNQLGLDSEEEEDFLTANLTSLLKQNQFNQTPLPPIVGSEEFLNKPFMRKQTEELDAVVPPPPDDGREEYVSDIEEDDFVRIATKNKSREVNKLMEDILPESEALFSAVSNGNRDDGEIFDVVSNVSEPAFREANIETIDVAQVNQSTEELIKAQNNVAGAVKALNLEKILHSGPPTLQKRGSLFDDVDDDEDIFKPESKPEVTRGRPSQINTILTQSKDDDDDLFAVGPSTKRKQNEINGNLFGQPELIPKATTSQSKSGSGGDDLFSESDGLFDNVTKVPAAKKPENYLSFLSDDEDDIFAAKNKVIDTKAIKSDTPSKSPLPVPEDDEEDIFSSKAIPKSPLRDDIISEIKPNVIIAKSKQPTKKLSFFLESDEDDDSDIFSTKFSASSSKPVSSSKPYSLKNDGEDIFGPPPPQQPKPKPFEVKPRASISVKPPPLLQNVSDEDEDDLFALPRKSSESVTTKIDVKPVTTNVGDEDNFFAVVPKTNESSSKPVSQVSNADIPDLPKEKPLPAQRKPFTLKSVDLENPKDLKNVDLNAPEEVSNRIPKTIRNVSRMDPKAFNNLAGLKDELTKKLAVKMPPRPEDKVTSEEVDKTNSAKGSPEVASSQEPSTLNNDILKNRAKPNLKRRNPTRKPLKTENDALNDGWIDDEEPKVAVRPPTSLSVPPLSSMIKSPSTEEEDFFQSPTFGDSEDLFSRVVSGNSKNTTVSTTLDNKTGSVDRDLFSTLGNKVTPSRLPDSDDESDLFYSTESSRDFGHSFRQESKPGPVLPTLKSELSQPTPSKAAFQSDSDDDDIFKSAVESKSQIQAIFGGLTSETSSPSVGPVKQTSAEKGPLLFGNSDDEDDLFAEASKSSKSSMSRKPEPGPKSVGDAEEDLFSKLSTGSTKSSKLKMFAAEDDEEDIFSSNSPSKSKLSFGNNPLQIGKAGDEEDDDDLFVRR